MSAAAARLMEERKSFRKDKPFGFVAKPVSRSDGSVNMFMWECRVPGKQGTIWEGGLYPVTILFTEQYPAAAPSCHLPSNFYHPNVYPDGMICLSILNDDADMGGQWAPSISIKQVLLGIQELLHDPNIKSPAQMPATLDLQNNKAAYIKKVKAQVAKYPSDID